MTAIQPFGPVAASARVAPAQLSIFADMSDCWPEFEPLFIFDFLLDRYEARGWAIQPGTYGAVVLERNPITELALAADLSAAAYAVSAYTRPIIAELGLTADFAAGAYAVSVYTPPVIVGLGLTADFAAGAYAAPAYTRPAIAGLGLAADFSADTYAAN